MSAGLEWSGYASQALSGVSEALDAAGIDCTVGRHDSAEGDPGSEQSWWESNEPVPRSSQRAE